MLIMLCTACNKSTDKYKNLSLSLKSPTLSVNSNDAKFFRDYIIAGVGGNLSILDLNLNTIKTLPEIKVRWVNCIENERIIIYSNSEKQIGIAKLDDGFNLLSNEIILTRDNRPIDPTIIHINDYYYITFTEIIGKINNSDKDGENGEYKLYFYRSKNLSEWEEVSVILDNFNNTEDVDIMYIDNHFVVTYEFEDYDKGCSALMVTTSKDSEGKDWNEPKSLIPSDADHEMACIFDEGNSFTLWYSSDKDDVGKSYMAGKIYYAKFTKDFELISKDNLVEADYNTVGGVRLYEVKKLKNKLHFLYAKDYLTENRLSILVEK